MAQAPLSLLLVATLLAATPAESSSTDWRVPFQLEREATTRASLAKLASPDARIRNDGLDELLLELSSDPAMISEPVSAIATGDPDVNARLKALLLLKQPDIFSERERAVIDKLKRDPAPDVSYEANYMPSVEEELASQRRAASLIDVPDLDRFFDRARDRLRVGRRRKPDDERRFYEMKLLALSRNARSGDEVRQEALQILGSAYEDGMRSSPNAAAFLVPSLAAPSWRVRGAAAYALGYSRRASRRALDALCRALADPVDTVGTVAAIALGKIRPPASARGRLITALLAAFESGLNRKRIWAASTLGILEAAEAADPLARAAMEETNQKVQVCCLNALKDLGPAAAAALPRLQTLLTQPGRPTAVIVETLRALRAIGPAAAPVVPAITALLETATDRVLEAAVLALAQIGPAADVAVPALLALPQRLTPPIDEQLLKAIEYALELIGTERARAGLKSVVDQRKGRGR